MLGGVPKNSHRLAEERSLALHREIAERISSDPRVLELARKRVRDAVAAGGPARPWYERWQEILGRSPTEVASFLIDDGEEARALRQVTPFAGVIPARRRWRIWREVRERWEAS